MKSKLQNKCTGSLLSGVLRSQRGSRSVSIKVDQLPTLAGLSLAGLFADRAGIDAFVLCECITGEAKEVHHAIA